MAHFQHWTVADAAMRLSLGASRAIGYDPTSGACIFLPRNMTGFEATVGFRIAIPDPQEKGSFLRIGTVRTKPENEEGAIKIASQRFTEMYNRYLSRLAPPTM